MFVVPTRVSLEEKKYRDIAIFKSINPANGTHGKGYHSGSVGAVVVLECIA
jgi:hypothetical protein